MSTTYPIEGREHFVEPGTIRAFLDALRLCESAEATQDPHHIALRGLGENGTAQAGQLKNGILLDPAAGLDGCAEALARNARRWASYDGGTFIVPARIREGAVTPKDDDVLEYTSLVVDLDNEAIADKGRHYLERIIGPASIVVRSSGAAKMHLYWLLDEAAADVREVGILRKQMALLSGGDPSFFRLPQIIRVPGTAHCKNGVPKPVLLERCEKGRTYDLGEVARVVAEAERPAWVPVLSAKDQIQEGLRLAGGGQGLAFSAGTAGAGEHAEVDVRKTVREGGVDDVTRYEQCGRVIGKLIRDYRAGAYADEPLDSVWQDLVAWNDLRLSPPFPVEKLADQWARLTARDIADKGPLVPGVGLGGARSASAIDAQPVPRLGEEAVPAGGTAGQAFQYVPDEQDAARYEAHDDGYFDSPDFDPEAYMLRTMGGGDDDEPEEPDESAAPPPPRTAQAHSQDDDLPPLVKRYRTDNWTMGEKPRRVWLVQGLIAHKKSHMLAAEGGVGKTFAVLDLALKLTAPQPGDAWFGQAVYPDHPQAKGTVVILTAEDEAEELHIRLAELDPDGSRRRAAGRRLVVVPLLDTPAGMFTLCDREPKTGQMLASPIYADVVEQLKLIPDLALVVLDTLASTMHGDENSAVVSREWMSQASRITREANAAWIVTHHMRKPDRGTGRAKRSRTLETVREEIRGSGAFIGSMRLVMAIYEPDDKDEIAGALGMPGGKGRVFKLGVAKANNPEAMRGERILARAKHGGLEDRTAEHEQAVAPRPEDEVWALWTLYHAANVGRAYANTGKTGFIDQSEMPRDAEVMPERLMQGSMTPDQRRDLLGRLRARGSIVAVPLDNGSGTSNFWVVRPGQLYAGHPGNYQFFTPEDRKLAEKDGFELRRQGAYLELGGPDPRAHFYNPRTGRIEKKPA